MCERATAAIEITPAERIGALRPYAPPAPRGRIDLRLDSNEGPGLDERVTRMLEAIDPERIRRYPQASALESDLAARWEVEPARVVVTNGADDAIDRVCRAVLEPRRELLYHDPTFEMIPRSGQLSGALLQSVRWRRGPFPVGAFMERITSTTKLIGLVSPNNPTGQIIPTDEILAIVDAARTVGAVVLVDLAYAPFADEDPTPVLLEQSNVVVVRTFSKSSSLAGLRVGYAIAPPAIARWLRIVGGPYPTSSVSLALAATCLARGARWNDDGQLTQIRRERRRLSVLLESLGAEVFPSQANFVLATFTDAPLVRDGLGALGIAVRTFPRRDLGNCVRITLPASPCDFDRLTAGLRSVLRPEALLLDLDGVLADVSGSYRQAIIETASSFGVTITEDDITRAKQVGDANNDWLLTQRLVADRLSDRGAAPDAVPTLAEVTRRFQSCYLGSEAEPGLCARETLIPSAKLLARLATRIPLAIVTGRPRAEAVWFLERCGLSGLFRTIVAMEDAPRKPSPVPVQRALERLGVDSAWMVGDTPDDIQAARAAGVVPLGVVSPCDDPQLGREMLLAGGAARVLQNLDQLEGMLP